MSNRFSGLMLTTALRAPEGTDAAAVVVPAVVETPAAAPVVEAPAVVETPAAAEPVVETPAVVETPVVEPVKPEAADPAKPADAKGSLLTEAAKVEVKAEPTKPEEAAAAVVDPAAVVEPVKYEPFTMPEGVKAEGELLNKFTELLGAAKLPQEQGQAFLDLYGSATKAYAEHVESEQRRVWAETNEKWVAEIKADKEFGGNKFDTSTKAAMRMIDLLVPKAERADFNQFMDQTGAGNNPFMFKMLNRVAQWLDEPVMPKPATKPAKGNGKAPGAGRGLRSMYKDAN